MIIIDSREKPKAIKGIVKYFDDNSIEHMTSKLLIGDYMEYSRPELVIDRKQNIAELAKNCTVDHERFRRELERVKKVGARLIVLVEQNKYKAKDEWIKVETVIDLLRWSSPYSVVKGEKIYRVLASWEAKYPLTVEFCDKRSTGKTIVEILNADK